MNYELWPLILGFGVSMFGGALVLHILISRLAWQWATGKQREIGGTRRTLTIPLGILERLFYTATLLGSAPEWVAVWLAVKVAVGWRRWESTEERHLFNIFLIGNLLSILLGYLGAWIVLGKPPQLGT